MALDDVSFEVHPGEIVALLGPNGAGKTTASRIIGGILAPSQGEVLVDGISVQKDANAVRARHRAILLTTHDLDEAQRIADRVVVLYKGKVLRTGATADVRAAGRPSYTVAFAGDPVIAREALARAGIPAENANARDGLTAL